MMDRATVRVLAERECFPALRLEHDGLTEIGGRKGNRSTTDLSPRQERINGGPFLLKGGR